MSVSSSSDDSLKLAVGAAAAGLAAGWFLAKQFGGDKQGGGNALAAWKGMQLKPTGLRAGYDTGNPETCAQAFEKGNLNGAGLWECQPGGFPVKNRPTTETVYIISGKATITNDSDGSKTELVAGSWHLLPTGWSGRWDVTETIRKVYILTP
jgi:uncharacterized cupin superfamily protein